MGLDLTAGEVVWLLGLSRHQAIEEDAPGSSLGHLDGGGGEHHGIPTVARWSEVHAAKSRLVARARNRARAALDTFAMELRGRGYTESEVADLVGSSQQSVNRHFKIGLRELLDELEVDPFDTSPAMSRISMCLRCGVRPRARRAAVFQKVPGSPPREVQPERHLSVCARCVADPAGLMVGRRANSSEAGRG